MAILIRMAKVGFSGNMRCEQRLERGERVNSINPEGGGFQAEGRPKTPRPSEPRNSLEASEWEQSAPEGGGGASTKALPSTPGEPCWVLNRDLLLQDSPGPLC